MSAMAINGRENEKEHCNKSMYGNDDRRDAGGMWKEHR